MQLIVAILLCASLAFSQIGKGPGTGGGEGNGAGGHAGPRDAITRPQPKTVPVLLIVAGATGAVLLVKKLARKHRPK